MKILKKIILKFYHLISFLCLFVLFAPNVSASVVSTPLKDMQLYSGTSTLPRADKTFNNVYFVGGYVTNARFRMTFSNDFSNYSTVAFFLYDDGASVNSNPNYDNPVPPLVILDGSACSVLPIGGEDQNDTYYYDGLSYATCEVTSPSNHNLEIFTLHKGSSYFLGVNDYWRVFDKEATIDDVITSVDSAKQSIDKVDDTLKDSSVDSSDETINNLNSKIPANNVISDLLLLPVKFLQNFVNALGGSCSNFPLGSLYGTNLYMPCINLQSYLGSGIWTTIDLILSGLFIYTLRKKFIQIYENITNLKNGGNEVD